jgi:hypothetical protein
VVIDNESCFEKLQVAQPNKQSVYQGSFMSSAMSFAALIITELSRGGNSLWG